MTLIRIPKRFADDHKERDLDTPEVARETKTHYFVESNDPALAELHDDAKFYAEQMDFDDMKYLIGIVSSARATKRSIEQALGGEPSI